MITIGVLAIQGAVLEHVSALQRAANGLQHRIITIKKKGIVPLCDGLVIPGGESTTISRMMQTEGIDQEILDNPNMAIMGTCAGLIILSNYLQDEVVGLKLMDMQVKRNAFGRQADSFELPLSVTVFDSKFNGVFIRAPAITEVGRGVEVLARVGKWVVAAQQANKLALAFHPELSNDLRFHNYFLSFLSS
jgi:5'-phosphate synthase pdxT subunit